MSKRYCPIGPRVKCIANRLRPLQSLAAAVYHAIVAIVQVLVVSLGYEMPLLGPFPGLQHFIDACFPGTCTLHQRS